MRFAFTWEKAPRINRWSWLPGFRHFSFPHLFLYHFAGKEMRDVMREEHHLYIYWGYGQWHWVWSGEFLCA